METTISAPFEGCEDTLVRRISWSPDGQCLVATNSKDGVRASRAIARDLASCALCGASVARSTVSRVMGAAAVSRVVSVCRRMSLSVIGR